MKRRQMTALLLSAIMTVSSCMPMNGISVLADENTGAGSTEAAAVAEPESEEQVEDPEEETTDTEIVLTEDNGTEADSVEDADVDLDQTIVQETPAGTEHV